MQCFNIHDSTLGYPHIPSTLQPASLNTKSTPPIRIQTHPYIKPSPDISIVASDDATVVYTAIGIDIASVVAATFDIAVAIAYTNSITNSVATSIFTTINNDNDIPVGTVMTTKIATGIHTVIATTLDIVVDIVGVAIFEPWIRFLADTTSVYLTYCHI